MTTVSTGTAFKRDAYTIYLYFVLAVFGFKQSVLGSVTPFLRDEMELNTVIIGWHFTIYALGLISSALVFKVLSKNMTLPQVLRLSAITMVASVASLGLPSSLLGTLSVAFLLGITGGAVQITIQSALAQHHGKYQSVALVEAFVLAAAGVFAGPLAIGYAVEFELGWRLALLLPAFVLLVIFLVFSGVQQPVNHRATDEPKETSANDLSFNVYLILGMILLAIATEWGLGFWGAHFLQEQYALEPNRAVAMMSVFFGGTVFGRVIASRLLMIFQVQAMLITLIILGGLSVGLLWFSSSISVAWVALFIAGMCLGNFFPLILSIANEFAPQQSTSVSRGATLAVGLALVIVPYVIGQLGEIVGLTTAVGMLAFLPVLMLLLLFLAKARHNRVDV